MNTKHLFLFSRSCCKTLLAAASLLALGSSVTLAQTTPADSATGTFFNTVGEYFSSFDTNSTTFKSDRVEIWAGANQGHDKLSAVLGATVIIKTNWIVEGVFENANVAGTILSAGAGGGYRWVYYDTSLVLGADAGYRFDSRNAYISPFFDVRKALVKSANAYAGIRLYYQQEFQRDITAHAPGLLLITGVKF